MISYNIDGLKDSVSEYYDEDGYLDSSINYINGKINGIKLYYEDGGTFENLYKNDSLISKNWYDSSDVLKYSLPVNITNVSHTTIKFSSGRNYFDPNKTDTLELFNKGLPPFNRSITVSKGISLKHLSGDSSYLITCSDKFKNLKEIKIVIGIVQNLEHPLSNEVKFDSVYIKVR